MDSSAWTWSSEHNDYYRTTRNNDGSFNYFWAKMTSTSPQSNFTQSSIPQSAYTQSLDEERAHVSSYILPSQGQDAPQHGFTATVDNDEGKGIGGCGPHDQHTGQSLDSIYGLQNPRLGSHHEQLDPSFYVRPKDFFVPGKVFAILWPELAYPAVTGYNSTISLVDYGEQVHARVRRFVVVRQRRDFCYAIPISTYRGRGTTDPGVVPDEHAIAYSHGNQPTLLTGEEGLSKYPICIIMNQGESALPAASRIFFGVTHPVQYNVKVKDLGYVHPEHLATLLAYWDMENQEDVKETAEATASSAFE